MQNTTPPRGTKRRRLVPVVILYAVLMCLALIFFVRCLFASRVSAEFRGLYHALEACDCSLASLKSIRYATNYGEKFTVVRIAYEFEDSRRPEQLVEDAVAVRALTEQYLSQHPEEAAAFGPVEIEFHEKYDASPNYICIRNCENDGSVPDAAHLHRGHFVVQNAPLSALEGADGFAALTLWDFALPEDFSALDAQDTLRELNMRWMHPPHCTPQAEAAIAAFEAQHPDCTVNIEMQTNG